MILLVLGVSFVGCLDREYYKISAPTPTTDLSIPILKLNTTLGQLAENASDNTRVEADEEGKLTFFYEGQLLRQSAVSVFPPVPLFQDFIIADTVAPLPLPLEDTWILEKGRFKQNNIRFKFRTQLQEDINVRMRMPELSKDGQVFERNFEMIYDGSGENYFESELISLDSFDIDTDNSSLSFNYDARDESGNRIKFDEAFMFIDVVRFYFLQGFFGRQVFNLTGSTIPIGIFNNWTSGGFKFDDPSLSIDVENSFGFPVTTFFNNLTINTLSEDILAIESTAIENGVDFAFPAVTEIGESLFTGISITAQNSNIEDVFNQKATQLNYDIEAIVNPDIVDPVIGFFTEESFFTIDAAVEVPLHIQINDLVITENFDLDLTTYEQVTGGEIILAIKNALPLDTDLQFLFEDQNGVFHDYLQEDGSWTNVEARDVDGAGIDEQSQQVIRFPINETIWSNIRQSKSVSVNMRLNTVGQNPDDFIWIFDYHGIDLRVSATINQD